MRTPELLTPLKSAAFRRYWTALTMTSVGDGVTSVAMPLTAALLLDASPADLGWLTALAWIPSVVLSVPAAGLLSRFGHPLNSMIGADVVRFAAMASLPIAALFGVLNLQILYAVTVIVATSSVFFNVANAALFPALITDEQRVTGQALLYGSQTAASVGGSSLGALLTSLISVPVVATVDALSYLASAFFLTRTDRPLSVPAPRKVSLVSSEGMRFIAATPRLRAALGVSTTTNLFYLMFHALVILFLTETLHLPPAATGLLFGAEAVGAFIGSAFVPSMVRRYGTKLGLIIGSLLTALPLALLAAATGPQPLLFIMVPLTALVSGLGQSIQDISTATTFFSTVPVDLRFQVRGAYQTVSFAARPVGALLGGLMGQHLGLRWAIGIAAIGGTLAFLWALPMKAHTTDGSEAQLADV